MRLDGIKGKTAVVVGGGSGIGRATCLELFKQGARVAVLDISTKGGRQTCVLLFCERTEGVEFFKVDVGQVRQVERAAFLVKKKFGSIDMLAVTAGIEVNSEGADLTTMRLSSSRRIVRVNLLGLIHCLRAFLPRMKKGGAVVAVSSVQQRCFCEPVGPYQATKGAVSSLMLSMASHWARKANIRMNVVSPGAIIDTNMGSDRRTATPEDWYQRAIPLGRGGRAREVAQVIVFLLSGNASYVTGADWFVNGGLGGELPR